MKVYSQSNFAGIYKQNTNWALINLLHIFIEYNQNSEQDKNKLKNCNSFWCWKFSASYEVSLLIANGRNPQEPIPPAAEFSDAQQKKKYNLISLWNATVTRRIEDQVDVKSSE
jgi:hypothetical protein